MPQRFAKLFKEFQKFDNAWRTHLGVEPYENRETDPEFKNPLLEHALSENKVVITHNLRLFEEGDFAKFAAAVGKLEHVSVKGLTVEQSIPKELFYGSTNGQFIMVFLLACANRFCSFFRIPFFW